MLLYFHLLISINYIVMKILYINLIINNKKGNLINPSYLFNHFYIICIQLEKMISLALHNKYNN